MRRLSHYKKMTMNLGICEVMQQLSAILGHAVLGSTKIKEGANLIC